MRPRRWVSQGYDDVGTNVFQCTFHGDDAGQSVVDHALPAFAGQFEDLVATNSVFTWEPV